MAWGGGKFTVQNKVLPGYYFKLLSASKDAIQLSDRGKVACGFKLDWGETGKAITISKGEFQKDCAKYFGYDYTAPELAPMREIFKYATHLTFYRLNGVNTSADGNAPAQAKCKWAKAKYPGVRGNDITISVNLAVGGKTDTAEDDQYDVITYLRDGEGNNIQKDKQRVKSLAEIEDNDFVVFERFSGQAGVYELSIVTPLEEGDEIRIGNKVYACDEAAATAAAQATAIAALFAKDADFSVVATDTKVIFTQKIPGVGNMPELDEDKLIGGVVSMSIIVDQYQKLTEDAGSRMSGGENGASTGADHQDCLTAFERVHYHCLICNTNDAVTMSLYSEYQKRMSHDCGKVAQCVTFGYDSDGKIFEPDNYNIIVVENKVITPNVPEYYGIFWVGGAEGGCAVNKTVQNRIYDGEYKFDTDYTQDELAYNLSHGRFMFHETMNMDNSTDVRVLDDINSYVTVTEEENSNYKKNQLIRVIYQIIFDVGGTFNEKWQGVTPNDANGRAAFKGVVVKYLLTLQGIRAIQNVDEDRVLVEQGDTKGAVYMAIPVNNVVAMFQCYNVITAE